MLPRAAMCFSSVPAPSSATRGSLRLPRLPRRCCTGNVDSRICFYGRATPGGDVSSKEAWVAPGRLARGVPVYNRSRVFWRLGFGALSRHCAKASSRKGLAAMLAVRVGLMASEATVVCRSFSCSCSLGSLSQRRFSFVPMFIGRAVGRLLLLRAVFGAW